MTQGYFKPEMLGSPLHLYPECQKGRNDIINSITYLSGPHLGFLLLLVREHRVTNELHW